MFGGYQGVHTAFKPEGFSMTLNSRGGGGGSQIEKYFRIMGDIYEGLPEIGIATRDAVIDCAGFDCLVDRLSTVTTIVPIYLIMAGLEDN